jgi:hypothetical protein
MVNERRNTKPPMIDRHVIQQRCGSLLPRAVKEKYDRAPPRNGFSENQKNDEKCEKRAHLLYFVQFFYYGKNHR